MKKLTFVAFLLFISSCWLTFRAAAQCAGANMSYPIDVGTLSGGASYSNTQNNGNSCFGNDIGQPSNDIYYRFSINSTAQVDISHCSSSFDTYMWLLDANGNVITSNDDSGPVCSGTTASISQSLGAGTYYVVSEGYGSYSGDITTQINVQGGTGGSSSSWASNGANIYNTNTGNVGIGTTTPRGLFDVGKDGEIYLSSTPNGGASQSIFLSGHVYLAPLGSSDISYLQARRLNNSGSTALRLRTYNNGTLTEAMHISGNGNVGIGTINPQQRLDVNGNSIFSGTITASNLNDGTGVAKMVTVTNGVLGYQTISSGNFLPLSGGTVTGNITLNSGYDLVTNGGANSWGGYPGVVYYGGDGQFRFHGTNGSLNVFSDGNFYATDNNYLVLHAGNFNNYALPLSGGTLTGPLAVSGASTQISLDRADMNTESLINFKTAGVNNWHIFQDNGNNNLQIQRAGETDAAPRMRFNGGDGNIALGLNGGSVGIGTANPQARWHVEGRAYINTNDDDVLTFDNTDNSWQYVQFKKSGVRKTWLGLNDQNDFYINKEGGGGIILTGGNVGIGTANIGDAAYKLFVATGIRTPKIKVDPTAWADYVFSDAYRLPSLRYVESFIKQHRHLPEVPSAAEVEKEGLDVGANQALLLKKVEELTLYIIEQNKKLEQLQKELEQLKATSK